MLDSRVFGYRLAGTGRVKALIHLAEQYLLYEAHQDPVQSPYVQKAVYGVFPTTRRRQQQVEDDSTLWLRTLFMYAVAENAQDHEEGREEPRSTS